MHIIKKLYILAGILFFCFFSVKLYAGDYCKLSNKIVKTFVVEVAKPQGLHITGSGGAMMDDIKKIILSFTSYECLTVEEARKLYVELVDEFLLRFNENEKVRPYLHDYPFKPNNLDLMICFKDLQNKRVGGGFVNLIYHCNSKLCIDAYDSKIEQFYTLHKEPYEESVRIVHESREAKKS